MPNAAPHPVSCQGGPVPPETRVPSQSAGHWSLGPWSLLRALPSAQDDRLVGTAALEEFFLAIGPQDFNLVDVIRTAQAEMSPRIVAAQVTRRGIDQASIGLLA